MDGPGEWGVAVERLGQFTFYSVIGHQEEFAWVGGYAEGDGATRYMLGTSDGIGQDYSSEYLAHDTALGVAMDLRDKHMHLEFKSNQIDCEPERAASGDASGDPRQLAAVERALTQILNYASQLSHHVPGDFQQIVGLAYAARRALDAYLGVRDA